MSETMTQAEWKLLDDFIIIIITFIVLNSSVIIVAFKPSINHTADNNAPKQVLRASIVDDNDHLSKRAVKRRAECFPANKLLGRQL